MLKATALGKKLRPKETPGGCLERMLGASPKKAESSIHLTHLGTMAQSIWPQEAGFLRKTGSKV